MKHICSLNVSDVTGNSVNFLSGPHNRHEECLNRSYWDQLAEADVRLPTFSLQGFGKLFYKNTVTSMNDKD